MVGLKRIAEQNKFRNQCERAVRKADGEAHGFSVDVNFDTDPREDDAYEDDGCLHVRRYGLRAMFSIGQDTDGRDANAATRTILTALNMKRRIGPRVLVDEQCEECGGDGYESCSLGCEHKCSNCDGTGLVAPATT